MKWKLITNLCALEKNENSLLTVIKIFAQQVGMDKSVIQLKVNLSFFDIF